MEITELQKLLINGLALFPLTEENQIAIFLFLKTPEQQIRMIEYMLRNPKATEQEILNESGRIVESTMEKSTK